MRALLLNWRINRLTRKMWRLDALQKAHYSYKRSGEITYIKLRLEALKYQEDQTP